MQGPSVSMDLREEDVPHKAIPSVDRTTTTTMGSIIASRVNRVNSGMCSVVVVVVRGEDVVVRGEDVVVRGEDVAFKSLSCSYDMWLCL